MDKYESDADFDSYWDYEAKNKNRNRIRVGRQYQASVPPLLKPGEKDGRRCEDLETLKWKPDQINEQQVDEYLSMARAVALFARSIKNYRNHEKSANPLQTAFKGLSEFLVSHHPSHHDAGCKVPALSSSSSTEAASSSSTAASAAAAAPSAGESPSKSSSVNDWTTPEAHLFAQAVEACGKNFCAIKKEYLPWKPVRSLIEYYYQNGKGEKAEVDEPTESVPTNCSSCKIEKTESEPAASSSKDTEEKAPESDTKEKLQTCETVKEEDRAELQATSAATSKEDSGNSEVKQEVLQPTDCCKTSSIQSTVGSLKFFLGGRLVLKLNAKQNTSSGTKCQWVQSQDTPKHLSQARKLKHRKKIFQDSQAPITPEVPKHKKRPEEETSLPSAPTDLDGTAIKKLKLRTFEPESPFPPLCRGSWTPPVADGQDSVDLDDCSSKTSEGCASPIVLPSRIKAEVKTEIFSDPKVRTGEDGLRMDHEAKYDRKHIWIKSEFLGGPSSSHSQTNYSDECSSQSVGGFVPGKISPKVIPEDSSYSHEVLNHKSALVHKKNSYYAPRAAHTGSPNAKLYRKQPSPTGVELPERMKPTPGFHSPSSMTCSTSSESSMRDYVLDLSLRADCCENREASTNLGQDCCCQVSECSELNCSILERRSPILPCTTNVTNVACCKSSDCVAYPKGMLEPDAKNKGHNISNAKNYNDQLPKDSTSANMKERTDTACSVGCENEGQCPCCYNPSTSCASPKCCKNFSSKEHPCNSEDGTMLGPNFSSGKSTTDDAYAKKNVPWYGTSLLQFYPQCYQYYVAYGINPPSPANSTTEIPLDLSSNGNDAREEKTLQENLAEAEAELQKAAGDPLDRGMLYQLLKNKINK